MVQAHEITYGTEIETEAPLALCAQSTPGARDHLVVGSHHNGVQVPYLPAGWKAEHDGSIGPGAGFIDCEIVSPVLKGEDGLRQIQTVCKLLRQKQHKVTTKCGVHVHIGWGQNWPADALARLVTMTSYCEAGLYAITGTKARESGTYCRSVKQYGNPGAATERCRDNRYHILNLNNLATGEKRTVEFRVFSASLDPVKICGWVQVCVGLVHRAVNAKRNSLPWTPTAPSGGWKKKGPGQSEVERLFGFLAWSAGQAKVFNGVRFGWLGDVIPQEKIKLEFRRLAAKYDSMPAVPADQ